MEKKITLELTIDEANGVLIALSKMPYEAVHLLINKIIKQAEQQVQSNVSESISTSNK